MSNAFSRFRTAAQVWLPLAAAITVLSGLVYVAVQQNLRLSANDPQIQLAEDAALALSEGAQPSTVVPANSVDLGRSLAPYLMVFDDAGNVVASSVRLDGQPPVLPAGVLAYTKDHGEDRVTWQPKPGVRSATVLVRYGGQHPGVVLAGRSLREVEQRVDVVGSLVAMGWVAGLGLALGAALLVAFIGS